MRAALLFSERPDWTDRPLVLELPVGRSGPVEQTSWKKDESPCVAILLQLR